MRDSLRDSQKKLNLKQYEDELIKNQHEAKPVSKPVSVQPKKLVTKKSSIQISQPGMQIHQHQTTETDQKMTSPKVTSPNPILETDPNDQPALLALVPKNLENSPDLKLLNPKN